MSKLAEIERLLEAATPGPFESLNGYTLFAEKCCIAKMVRTDSDPDDEEQDGLPSWGEAEATLDLLVALRNAAPALLRLWKAAEFVEDYLGFHEGSAKALSDGGRPVVVVNGEDHADALRALRAALAALGGGT